MNLIELRNKVFAETVEKEKGILREELPGLLEGAVRARPLFTYLYVCKKNDYESSCFEVDTDGDLVVYLSSTKYKCTSIDDVREVCRELALLQGCEIGKTGTNAVYVRIGYDGK